MGIYVLDDSLDFPAPRHALDDPNGLLAIGGDLSTARLLQAYRLGIFPWFSDDQPILWWCPDPRCILYPTRLKISRSLRKSLRNKGVEVSFDNAFDEVIDACAAPRQQQPETWITSDMRQAYQQLHRMGVAHSVEVWHEQQLVGGLYGLSLGRAFFGESMFSQLRDSSKIALVYLCGQLRTWQFDFIDCQVENAHLLSLGCELIPREHFLAQLAKSNCHQDKIGPWQLSWQYQA